MTSVVANHTVLAGSPFDDPTSIGNVLLRLGLVSKDQILQAVERQARFNEAILGAMLVEMGIIKPQDVAKAMGLQQELRTATSMARAELNIVRSCIDDGRVLGDKIAAVIDSGCRLPMRRRKSLTLVRSAG